MLGLILLTVNRATAGELRFERRPLTPEQSVYEDGRVQSLVDRLGGETADIRNLAEFKLPDLPASDLPRIEADFKKASFDDDAKARVARLLPRLKLDAARANKESDQRYAADQAMAAVYWAHYVKTGPVDPKWDADVRTALTDWAFSDFIDVEAQKPTAAGDGAKAADAAITAGCKDDDLLAIRAIALMAIHAKPDVLYSAAEAVDTRTKRLDLADPIKMALGEVWMARYAAVQHDGATGSTPEFDRIKADALSGLLGTVTIPGVPPAIKVEGAKKFMKNFGPLYDEEAVTGQIVDALKKTSPDDSASPSFKSEMYLDMASTLHNSKPNRELTTDDWANYNKRLKISAEAAEVAWELDPRDWNAIFTRLRVSVDLNEGPAAAKVWYDRAVELNPNRYELHVSMMQALLSDNGGSEEAALEFARAKAAEGDWHSRAPLVLVAAHMNIDWRADPQRNHMLEAGVWDEMKPVLMDYFKLDLQDVHFHSCCARAAYRAGDYKTADAMFKKLGSRVDVAIFKNSTEMALARRESAKKAAE